MTNASICQVKLSSEIAQRKSYVTKFDKSKVFYKKTLHKIPDPELLKIVEDNPRTFFERETDDEGNIIRYLYDPNDQNGDGAKNIFFYFEFLATIKIINKYINIHITIQ